MSGTQNGRSPRSVALVGPYSSGKSTLFEALMESAGAPVKRPADPRNRPATTEVRFGHCSYLGDTWAVLDCPGSVEFAYETGCALSMVDLAVVVCEPAPARALTVAPLLKQLADDGVPHMLFINKIDTLEGSVSDTLAALQGYAKSPLVLRQVPIMHGETVSGYVDVVSERAYRYRKGQASELIQVPSEMQDDEQDALNKLVEVLADRDDVLLEKVLEDVKPTTAEIYGDLRKDLAAGAVIEVLLGSAENAGGVRRLWKALRHDTPMAPETAARRGVDADGPPLAQVFKTVYAGHTGKLSYARIWRGAIKDGVTLGNTRLGGIYRMPGGELAKVAEASEGDIVALGRLEGVPTGATVSPGAAPEQLPFPVPPDPVYSLAISTSDHKDDAKLSGALQKQREADLTLGMEQQQDTSETVLYGQGEMHLNSTVERLARDYGLKVNTHRPQIAYKETIRRPVHQHGRLKKQSGGHGQFADVKIDIAPRPRGDGFQFVDKIVGG
ncbi:MAG TPA: elongation factor G, partial [Acetobacteraceae bacterium]|nr:elongation factor G [Acetobacteraceae bacterium]